MRQPPKPWLPLSDFPPPPPRRRDEKNKLFLPGPSSTCSIESCERSVAGRGWCYKHYSAWRRNGDPLKDLRYDPEKLAATRAREHARTIARGRMIRAIAKEHVSAIRAKTPCAHCGKPMADWHNPEHVLKPDRRVGRMVTIGKSIAQLDAEIAVCVPLCRSCHVREDRWQSPPAPMRGTDNPRAKLTEPQAREIRQRGAIENRYALAFEFGVSKSTINDIVRGRSWRHLT